tara:strand:+ start:1019 stop:1195 length:177 start_codon:yes stop_codon:yes gene_type:complete
MQITSAQYYKDSLTNQNVVIQAIIDGVTCSVPISPANRHYNEIMRQVAAGELTIADAD